ncbi:hypothetical protein RDWZM_006455 [Blomia tropicalis]|uniref:C3H1-type domain-containing protein n=1 Tax=Blomia tropicalis TaxID=40697 RepID=A0A9Q0RLS5_BLOTA|nr:hypothetical protein RDWZM_006455 [Blomia tropicalis]
MSYNGFYNHQVGFQPSSMYQSQPSIYPGNGNSSSNSNVQNQQTQKFRSITKKCSKNSSVIIDPYKLYSNVNRNATGSISSSSVSGYTSFQPPGNMSYPLMNSNHQLYQNPSNKNYSTYHQQHQQQQVNNLYLNSHQRSNLSITNQTGNSVHHQSILRFQPSPVHVSQFQELPQHINYNYHHHQQQPLQAQPFWNNSFNGANYYSVSRTLNPHANDFVPTSNSAMVRQQSVETIGSETSNLIPEMDFEQCPEEYEFPRRSNSMLLRNVSKSTLIEPAMFDPSPEKKGSETVINSFESEKVQLQFDEIENLEHEENDSDKLNSTFDDIASLITEQLYNEFKFDEADNDDQLSNQGWTPFYIPSVKITPKKYDNISPTHEQNKNESKLDDKVFETVRRRSLSEMIVEPLVPIVGRQSRAASLTIEKSLPPIVQLESSWDFNSQKQMGLQMPSSPTLINVRFKDSLYKTEMCRNMAETSSCPFGVECRFAHAIDELRPFQLGSKHTKYKTAPCNEFEKEICYYGKRCWFIHQTDSSELVIKSIIQNYIEMFFDTRFYSITDRLLNELMDNNKEWISAMLFNLNNVES